MHLKDNISSFLASGAIISLDQKNAWIGYGQSMWRRYEDLKGDQPAFYFSDFFLTKERPWLQFVQSEYLSLKAIEDILESETISSVRSSYQWHNPDHNHFDCVFHDLQSMFAQNILRKAVPYVFCSSKSSMSPAQLHQSLKKTISYAQSYPCHVYGFWNTTEGILGITPELLFEYQNNKASSLSSLADTKADTKCSLSTMALAGTSPKGQCLKSFMENPKEQREHQCTIDGIKESFQHLGAITVGNTAVLELPNLNHLLTRIEIVLDQQPQFEDIVRLMHPTPALGAFPSKVGRKWLESYERQVKRNYFGAPIGVLDPQKNKGKCVVGIRNVQWNNSGMKIGAGCGVIKDSIREKEWQEIQLKLTAIKDALDL